ncbi:MAG: mechanosensitive ion channel family protein [Acidobacteriaceae bacterium]
MWAQIHQALQQSIQRVIYKVATLLPGVLALVLALLVFAAIGWLLAWALRRILSAVQFDARAEKWGIADVSEWSPANSPTFLVTRIVFWACLLIGLFVGVAAFDASSASSISAYVMGYLSKVVAAVVVLLVGIIVARFLSRSVLINGVNMNMQHARLLSLGVKWLVLVFTAAMVLDHLGIARGIVDLGFGILFGGIVLALALAVGLGSRDLVSRSLEREAQKPHVEEHAVRHF